MRTFDINKLVRKKVLAMQSYSSARDEFKDFYKDLIFLDANENPFENGLNRYPDPKQKSLKKKLSELKNIRENQIILGNGSDELLDLLFRAFCEPNRDSVITLPPTYGMYSVLANLNAVENKEIVLQNDFEPNVDLILKATDETTKILFLCSPNNPTGNSFSEDNMERLLADFSGLIVIDEAYIDFSSKESWLQKTEQFPNLIILQTLSKAYGLAGIRLGILYANAQIIAVLDKIKPPYNVNKLTQEKALERIENYDVVLEEIKMILTEREKLIADLNTIAFIEKIYNSDANFILVKVDDAKKRYDQLLEKGIVIRNRSNQELCGNCLRITIGTEKENRKLLEILKSL
ncbi:histidinol-phosphate transaminase [Flavobacterium macacae]|uniref:Histidinol-phosphate aminotransferase n=1 Tax=Flavobacterium macacae TaxID=2488993 RepID=A0A3P3WAF9_9FLAO|nr:histidinol-phosphate transaminase [Flavobacterium macacae]RRJ91347.1 histidinol-phosphate transaminase [Flavobacterium macacae]